MAALRRALNLSLSPSAPSPSSAKPQPEIGEEPPSHPADATKQREGFAALIPRELGQISSAETGQPATKPSARWMDFVNRALSWLRTGSAAPKQLRVSETVALGEKRFVAIVQAEGHKFLIGGSAAGVSLLTRLDEQTNSAVASEVTPVLVEAAQ